MNSANNQIVSTVRQRQQSTSFAVASVRAEGLNPTTATTKRLSQYVKGIITADQLYKQTIAEIKARNKQTVV